MTRSGCSHSGIARRGLDYSKLGGRSGENPCDIRLLRLNWTLVSSSWCPPGTSWHGKAQRQAGSFSPTAQNSVPRTWNGGPALLCCHSCQPLKPASSIVQVRCEGICQQYLATRSALPSTPLPQRNSSVTELVVKSGPVGEPHTPSSTLVYPRQRRIVPSDPGHPLILWSIAPSSRCAWPYRWCD